MSRESGYLNVEAGMQWDTSALTGQTVTAAVIRLHAVTTNNGAAATNSDGNVLVGKFTAWNGTDVDYDACSLPGFTDIISPPPLNGLDFFLELQVSPGGLPKINTTGVTQYKGMMGCVGACPGSAPTGEDNIHVDDATAAFPPCLEVWSALTVPTPTPPPACCKFDLTPIPGCTPASVGIQCKDATTLGTIDEATCNAQIADHNVCGGLLGVGTANCSTPGDPTTNCVANTFTPVPGAATPTPTVTPPPGVCVAWTQTPSSTPTATRTLTPSPTLKPVKIFAVPRVGTSGPDSHFVKDPFVAYAIGCTFTRQMGHADTLTTAVFSAAILTTPPTGCTNDVVDATTNYRAGQTAVHGVHAGTPGCQYQLTWLVGTDSGNQLRCDVRMDVESSILGP